MTFAMNTILYISNYENQNHISLSIQLYFIGHQQLMCGGGGGWGVLSVSVASSQCTVWVQWWAVSLVSFCISFWSDHHVPLRLLVKCMMIWVGFNQRLKIILFLSEYYLWCSDWLKCLGDWQRRALYETWAGTRYGHSAVWWTCQLLCLSLSHLHLQFHKR